MNFEKRMERIWKRAAQSKRTDTTFQMYRIFLMFTMVAALIPICTMEIIKGKGFK